MGKEVYKIHSAIIRKYYTGCDFKFSSNDFKWVYYAALHFARQAIYLHPFIDCIVISFSNGIKVAVNSTGITIETSDRVLDIGKENK